MAPPMVTEAGAPNIPKAPAAPSAAPALPDVWAGFLHISLPMTVESPVIGLTVRELFRLEKGSIVTTSQSSETNVAVRAGGALIGWGEFQVVGEKLAVRLAELA